MDSYGHPARNARYPMPTPPQTTTYQVNVRRNKTRKWVEAKAQSYDGDDWGAEEFEEDEDEDEDEVEERAEAERKSTSPPPPTQYPPTQRAQLGSGLPSARSGNSTPTQKSGLSDLPSLRAQGRQTPVSRGASPPSRTSTFERTSWSTPQQSPDNGAKLAEDDYAVEPSISTSSDVSHGAPISVGTVDEISSTRKSLSDWDRRTSWEGKGESVGSSFPSERISQDVSQGSGANAEVGSELGRKAGTLPEEPRRSPTLEFQRIRTGLAAAAPAAPTTTNDDARRQPGSGAGLPLTEADDDESANAPGGASLTAHAQNQDASQVRDLVSIRPNRSSNPQLPRSSTIPEGSIHYSRTTFEGFQSRSLRRKPTLNTAGSSPVKESDVLSAEIMRSLGVSGTDPSGLSSKENAQHPILNPLTDQDPARGNGNYHDTYWGSAAKEQQAQTTETEAPRGAGARTSPSPDRSSRAERLSQPANDAQIAASQAMTRYTGDSSVQTPELRRRFSWEQDEDVPAPSSEPSPSLVDDHATDAPGSVAPARGSTVAPRAAPSGVEVEGLSPQSTPRTQHSVLAADDVSEQTVPQDQETSSIFGAQSTASAPVASERGSTAIPEYGQEGVSLANRTPGGMSTSTSTPEDTPVFHPSATVAPLEVQPTATKLMSFKDILGLGSTMERILKFNENRKNIAAQEHGLDSWLSSLSARHSELGLNSSGAFGSGAQVSPGALGDTDALPAQSTNQQPYYQQYLNASNSNPPSTSSTSRSRLGGLPIPTQMSSSAFSHSGTQIGTKSKEFMQSAGKMGKGLLSKGKSKFRGSGDKDEPPLSPAHQSPNKGEKRMPWRLSLATTEPKSRNIALAPLDDEESVASQPTSPPQLPAQSPVSPFEAESETGAAPLWAVPYRAPASVHPKSIKASDKAYGQEPAQTIQLPTSEETTEILPEGSLTPHQDVGGSHQNTLEDWVMISPQSDDEQFQPIPSAASSQEVVAPALAPEDSGVGLHPPPSKGVSAAGFPRIDGRAALGPLSLPINGSADMSGRKAVDKDKPLPPINFDSPTSPTRSSVNYSSEVNEHEAYMIKISTARPYLNQQVNEPQDETLPVERHRPDRQQIESRVLPYLKSLPPPSRKSLVATNSIKRLPPAGTWKLEESYLSEPLQPVGRRRSNTDSGQREILSSFDKDLGLEISVSPITPVPVSPAQTLPPRQRSDVPPSSAQRYPELFAPQQPGPTHARGQPHLQIPVPPFASRDGRSLGETPESSPLEERHRRRSSGVFKDLGQRVVRAASRERRGSISESRPSSAITPGEELSKTISVTGESQEPRKRRPSFLGFMGGRPSIDQQSFIKTTIVYSGQPQEDGMALSPSWVPWDQKRPMTGNAQQQSSPKNMDRSFSGGLAISSSAVSLNEGKEQKRRVTGIAGLFARARQGRNVSNGPAAVIPEDVRPHTRAVTESVNHKGQPISTNGLFSSALGRKMSTRSRSRPPVPPVQTQLPLPKEAYQLPQPQFGSPILDLNEHLSAVDIQPVPPKPLVNGRVPDTPAVTVTMTAGKAPQILCPQPRASLVLLKDPAMQTDPGLGVDSQTPSTRESALAEGRQSEADQTETPSESRPVSGLALPLVFGGKLEALSPFESHDDLSQGGDLWGSYSTTPGISVPSNPNLVEQRAIPASQALPSRSGDNEKNDSMISLHPEEPPNGSVGAASNHSLLVPPQSPSKLPFEGQKRESAQSMEAKKQQTEAAAATTPLKESSLRTAQSMVSDGSSVKIMPDSPSSAIGKAQRIPSLQGYTMSQAHSVPNLSNPQQHREVKQDEEPRSLATAGPQKYRSLIDVSGTRENIAPAASKLATSQSVQAVSPGRSGMPPTQSSTPPRQQESPGFRWKGLRSRVAEMALATQQQGQSKFGRGDKAKAGNLLGALRRSAKQSEPLNAQYAQDVWQQGPPFSQQSSQSERSQAAQPLPTGPSTGNFNKSLPPKPSAEALSPDIAQQRLSDGGNMTSVEPRYDPVPIPKGYSAVHGEGTIVPTQYQVRRAAVQNSQAPSREEPAAQQQQQRTGSESINHDLLRSRFNGLASGGLPRRTSGVSDTSQGQQVRSSRNSSLYTSQQDMSSPGSSGKPDALAGESGASSMGVQSTPQSPKPSIQESIEQGAYPSSRSLEINKLRQQQQPDGRMRTSSHPPGDEERETTREKVAKSSSRGEGEGKGKGKGKGGEMPRASDAGGARKDSTLVELEDTEEARMRAIRLASQEEKIAIDPEDLEPKMSATSYPGQEWNPFEDGEYGDWSLE